MPEPSINEMEPRPRRRHLVLALLRALLTATVLVALYYLLPLDGEWRISSALRMVIGLALFVAVLIWQIRKVLTSRHPGLRAIEALAVTLPLFLLLFASTYFLMAVNGSGTFSEEHLSRTDALYFAVTMFATVGFGDITPTSQGARVVVTFQMLLDLVILGVGINAFVSAARVGRKRQSAADEGGPASP
ncbi:MAG: potassium channel family protein [Actinomycetota bacterium]